MGLGSAGMSPAGSGTEPQPKSNLVHFILEIRHLVATVVMIFLRINWPHFVQFEVWTVKANWDQNFSPPGCPSVLPQCNPFCNGICLILQFCLGSNVDTRPIDSSTKKKSFNVSWLKLAHMSDLIMATNKSLNKHRVQKINTTLWCRAGKILGFLEFFYRFLDLFRFLSFFLDFNLQMPDTLQPKNKYSAMRTPQIAIPT